MAIIAPFTTQKRMGIVFVKQKALTKISKTSNRGRIFRISSLICNKKRHFRRNCSYRVFFMRAVLHLVNSEYTAQKIRVLNKYMDIKMLSDIMFRHQIIMPILIKPIAITFEMAFF